MTRTRERDAQWATLDAHRENTRRGRPVGHNKDATAVLHMPGVDDTAEALERREAALKITDMAAGQHDCDLGDHDTCDHPDHGRDADLARMALDAFGLDDLTDEADLDLAPEPASGPGKGDPNLSRSTFTRPDWRWQDSAVCRGEDLAVFFGRDGESRAERDIREAYAKDLCDMCPARQACLEYAFSKPEKYGVYGGLTEDERKEQRRNWMRRKRTAA